MSSYWSIRKQLQIIGVLILGGVLIVGLPVLLLRFSYKPTCHDNKKNGTEVAVDCGGSCLRMCIDATLEKGSLIIEWVRAVPVSPGLYNIVALVRNQHPTGIAHNVSFTVTLRTAEGDIETPGSISIPQNGEYAIFIPATKQVTSVPTGVSISIDQRYDWYRSDTRRERNPLVTREVALEKILSRPRVTGFIDNIDTLYSVPNVSAVAVVYDATDTAVGVSQTQIGDMGPGQSRSIAFTWPAPFNGIGPFRVQIYPLFTPFVDPDGLR